MRLQERFESILKESIREVTVSRKRYKISEKAERAVFKIVKNTEPCCFMILKNTNPTIKHGMCDVETEAEFFYSTQVEKVFTNDPKNKEKTVRTIRN